MKKNFITIIAMLIFLCSCPSDIKNESYGLYTINGIVTQSDLTTPIANILIEVRNELVIDDDEDTADNSDDTNHDESDDTNDDLTGDQNSSGDGNIIAVNFSSGDENSIPANNSQSLQFIPINVFYSESGIAALKNSSPDENPVLGSCRTSQDGTFSVTFKTYESLTNEVFIIYASDDDAGDNGGTFDSKQTSVDLSCIEAESGNPFGTYHKNSKTLNDVIISM